MQEDRNTSTLSSTNEKETKIHPGDEVQSEIIKLCRKAGQFRSDPITSDLVQQGWTYGQVEERKVLHEPCEATTPQTFTPAGKTKGGGPMLWNT